MKKLAEKQQVEVIESDEGDLMNLLGQKVILMCMNYNYVGTLLGVNEKYVMLGDDSAICYETGSWNEPKWKDAQPLNKRCRVMIGAIESYFEGK